MGRVHLKEIRSITQMRAKICLLAALSLAFNLVQVESGCGRSDPCHCEHEQVAYNAYKIRSCWEDFKALGCQLNTDENDSSAGTWTMSCKNMPLGSAEMPLNNMQSNSPMRAKRLHGRAPAAHHG